MRKKREKDEKKYYTTVALRIESSQLKENTCSLFHLNMLLLCLIILEKHFLWQLHVYFK